MENRYNLVGFFLSLVFLFTGCSPKVYESKTAFEESLEYSRKLVAILPLEISAAGDTALNEAMYTNRQHAYTAQTMMYNTLLDEFGRKKYNVDFQDINKTNAILRSNQISYEELITRDKAALCRLLRVDAVLSGYIRSSAPLLEDDAEKVIGIDPVRPFSNPSTAVLTLHEQAEGKLVWRHDYKTSTVVGNKLKSVVSDVMKKVSSQFPRKK